MCESIVEKVLEKSAAQCSCGGSSAGNIDNATIKSLKRQVRKQTFQMDKMEQDKRSDHVIIKGVVHEESEDTAEKLST